MKLINKYFCTGSFLMLLSFTLQAQNNLSLGVVLNGTGWSGDNSLDNSNFKSDKGSQFGLSVSYSRNKFYAGISLQGGEYQFDKTGPEQITSTGNSQTNAVKLNHSDLDILAGYYFWQKISLFVDLKAAGSEWLNNGYEQNFTGLGFGVSGYHPLDEKWTLYGSWGFVVGKNKESDETELGDGSSNALILGANYKLSKNDRISMGMKIRNFRFDYDTGPEQEYSLNGLFVGYNHVFSF